MKRNFYSYLLAAMAASHALPTLAAETATLTSPATLSEAIAMGQPMTSFRLRYENVDVANKSEHANAITMRSLIGWQTKPLNNFSVAAQLINVAQLNNDFYDGTPNTFGLSTSTPADKRNYPLVVDPDFTGINQLYVEWTGLPQTQVRLGRQSVKLDNTRFIGNVEYRQIMQVFDGLAVENKSIKDVELYAAHFEGLRRITSQYISQGNVDIAHARWKHAPGQSLTAYGYLQNMPLNGFNPYATSTTTFDGTGFSDNSSRTLGLRADGSRKLEANWQLLYTAEYAKQDAYQAGDSRIDAHYWRLGGGAGFGSWSARLDHERLSSNDGLYGFQTPLATGHLFQGLGDSFLTTPKEGIADTFITVNGKLLNVQLSAEYHWLNADRDFSVAGGGSSQRYGKELDLIAGYNYDKNWSGKLEYFSYKEAAVYSLGASRKPDSNKFMATMLYSF